MNQRTYYSEEAKYRARREMAIILGVVLALGISIGTAIAMLFAPSSGEETREELADVTEHAYKRLEDKFNKLRKQVEDRLPS